MHAHTFAWLLHTFSFAHRVGALYPPAVEDPTALKDTRVHDLIEYAMKVRYIVRVICHGN